MDSPLVDHGSYLYVLPLRAGGPRSGGGVAEVARQQVKDSHPIPAYAVLPLKGKTKEKKGFVVLLLLEDGKRKASGHYTEAFCMMTAKVIKLSVHWPPR